MNRRRRTLFVVLTLLLLALGIGVALLWPERDLTRECFERIQIGMPFKDVERLLREYGFEVRGGGIESGYVHVALELVGEGVIFHISHDDGGIVRVKQYERIATRENPLQKLWRRLTGWRAG
jgi:hypothetical protein